MLSLLNWLSGASYASFRTHPMPDQLEAFKLADRAGIRNRTMFAVLVIASIVGIESSLLICPYAIYKTGVAANAEQIHAGGLETYNFLSSWLINPKSTNWLAGDSSCHRFLFQPWRDVHSYPVHLVPASPRGLCYRLCAEYPRSDMVSAIGCHDRAMVDTQAQRNKGVSTRDSIFCGAGNWRNVDELLLGYT